MHNNLNFFAKFVYQRNSKFYPLFINFHPVRICINQYRRVFSTTVPRYENLKLTSTNSQGACCGVSCDVTFVFRTPNPSLRPVTVQKQDLFKAIYSYLGPAKPQKPLFINQILLEGQKLKRHNSRTRSGEVEQNKRNHPQTGQII